jgi:hypothetical protein
VGKAGSSEGIRVGDQGPQAATPSAGGHLESEHERPDEAKERQPTAKRVQEPTRREAAKLIMIPQAENPTQLVVCWRLSAEVEVRERHDGG